MFELINAVVRRSQFLARGANNAQPYAFRLNNSWVLRFISVTHPNGNKSCSCGTSSTCSRPQGFYCKSLKCYTETSLPDIIVPGLVMGCFPVDPLLLSTFECLYNQSCVQMVIDNRLYDRQNISTVFKMNNITALDPDLPSQFLPNTTGEHIASKTFIEQWITNTTFDAHYGQCEPEVCTYTFIQRPKPVYIITSVIGLIGELTVILQLFVPPTLKIIKRIYHCKWRTESKSPWRPSVLSSMQQRLVTCNIYVKRSTHTNAVLATRFYLLLLILAITIITLFLGLEQKTHLLTVQSPTDDEFNSLLLRYPVTLTCPCSKIAVTYDTFLTIEPIYHQVCSSYFTTSDWSIWLFSMGNARTVLDWYLLSAHFRLLQAMCEIGNITVNQSILEFLANELVNTEPLSRELFLDQVKSAVALFIERVPATFRHTNTFIGDKFRANQIQNRYMTSWETVLTNATENYVWRSVPVTYNNGTCKCADGNSTCSRKLVLRITNGSVFMFPGFKGGCLPMDGLRQSTFECLATRTCFRQLLTVLGLPTGVLGLNQSIPTRFPPNTTTVGTIMDELFIESWVNSSNYSSYFAVCAPATCQYSYVERREILYILTTLLGLYGGLTVALQLIVWYGLLLAQSIHARCCQSAKIEPCVFDTKF